MGRAQFLIYPWFISFFRFVSERYPVISPPGSFATNQLATNHLATKQSVLATNNLTTVNHKPKRLIRCLCYVERCVAITNQATSYNSLVLSHNDSNNALSISTMLKFCLIDDSNNTLFISTTLKPSETLT